LLPSTFFSVYDSIAYSVTNIFLPFFSDVADLIDPPSPAPSNSSVLSDSSDTMRGPRIDWGELDLLNPPSPLPLPGLGAPPSVASRESRPRGRPRKDGSTTPQSKRGANLRTTAGTQGSVISNSSGGSGRRSRDGIDKFRSASSQSTPAPRSTTNANKVGAAKRALSFDVADINKPAPATQAPSDSSAAATCSSRHAPASKGPLEPVDHLQDTENCSDHSDADGDPSPFAPPDHNYDSLFKEVVDKVVDALEIVRNNVGAVDPSTKCTTILVDVPNHVSLYTLQRDIEMASLGHNVLLVTAQPGQAHLEGFLDEFRLLLGVQQDAPDKVVIGTSEYDKLRNAELFVIDNASRIGDEDWTKFKSIIASVKFEDPATILDGRVVFILLGDNMLNKNLVRDRITVPGQLPDAIRCCSRLSDAPFPTQHIRDAFNALLSKDDPPSVPPKRIIEHRDPLMAIITDGQYFVDSVLHELLVTALGKFPQRDQVLQLTCYDVPSFKLPDAESLYDFISFKGIKASPDYTPSDPCKQISQEKQR